MSKPCINAPACDNTVSDKSKLEECSLCRSNWYRWKKRRPAHVLRRRRNLSLYGARMDIVMKARKIEVNW